MSALDVQVGGGHYKDLKIQPVEYIHANGIGFMEGNVIKYITRWRQKNGIEDLKKVRHYVDLLIELEEKNVRKDHSTQQVSQDGQGDCDIRTGVPEVHPRGTDDTSTVQSKWSEQQGGSNPKSYEHWNGVAYRMGKKQERYVVVRTITAHPRRDGKKSVVLHCEDEHGKFSFDVPPWIAQAMVQSGS